MAATEDLFEMNGWNVHVDGFPCESDATTAETEKPSNACVKLSI